MNPLSFQIALRYLISKKSVTAINIITGVAMTGMMFGTMALILVLSVFNGFESLVVTLYQSFNPDIRITVREGKVFSPAQVSLAALQQLDEVTAITAVLEENAIMRYQDREYIGTIKGVDGNYTRVNGVSGKTIEGTFTLEEKGQPYAVLGAGVAGALGVTLENQLNALQIYVPRRGKETLSLDPSQAFVRKNIRPAGVFSIQQDFDSKYVLVPLEFVQDLLDYDEEISALEIKLKPGVHLSTAEKKIKDIAGNNFEVLNRYAQNKFLYRIMRIEKWAVFAILTLILLIASFNIIGSLSMLVIEKRKDIAVLKVMGADNRLIRKIFLLEGLLTSLAGSLAGALVAVLLCVIQMQFQIIKLQGSGTFVIDAYPVEIRASDFILVGFTIICISMGASWIPTQRAVEREAIMIHE
ncbi:MAG: membrane protein [Chitinophagales bacterium]|nr:MAG: membrane protein [Chitinophagales bacterium]